MFLTFLTFNIKPINGAKKLSVKDIFKLLRYLFQFTAQERILTKMKIHYLNDF